MSEPLIEKLKLLDSILLDVRKKYHIAQTELKNIKAKPEVDTAQINQLKLQLVELKNSNHSGVAESDALKQKLAVLDSEYQKLAEAHHTLTDNHKELIQKHAELKEVNQVLQDKNRSAAEHTKVVLERLTRIDQQSE